MTNDSTKTGNVETPSDETPGTIDNIPHESQDRVDEEAEASHAREVLVDQEIHLVIDDDKDADTESDTNEPILDDHDEVEKTHLTEKGEDVPEGPPPVVESVNLVRGDLLAGTRLLETLGEFISVRDYSAGEPGGIVVAAPHQASSGTPLSGGHDVNTGHVAQQLAEKLSAKCVVASELRTFIDLNKDPYARKSAGLGHHVGRRAFLRADNLLKLYYQSQIFASTPLTIVEIHGHVTGVFDFEVSTGFTLNARVSQDKSLIAALEAFRTKLIHDLHTSPLFSASPPTVGVFPLDSGIKFAATGTYTFKKIEKLRELGVNASGLHIELARELRPNPGDHESDSFYQELTQCLAEAINSFIHEVSVPAAFDYKDYLVNEFALEPAATASLPVRGFQLQQVPKALLGRPLALFNRRDMRKLGIRDSESALISAGFGFGDAVVLQAMASPDVSRGRLGIAKKFRDKLGLEPGDTVYVGKPSASEAETLVLGFVSHITENSSQEQVTVGTLIAEELEGSARPLRGLTLHAATGKKQEVSMKESHSLPHGKAVALSSALAKKLNVTFGDLVCLELASSAQSDNEEL